MVELDPRQRPVEALARIEAGEGNRLITDQAGRTIDRVRIAATSLEIRLGGG